MVPDDFIERIAKEIEEDIRIRLQQIRVDRELLRRGIDEVPGPAPKAEVEEARPAALLQSLAAIDAASGQREILSAMIGELSEFVRGSAIIFFTSSGTFAWPGPGLGLPEGEQLGFGQISLQLAEDSLVARSRREEKMYVAPFPSAPGCRRCSWSTAFTIQNH